MTTLASQEQLLLEMVNRARMDPAGEAARLGISLNQYINATSSGYPITGDPKQVLAGSNLLSAVAENHANVVFNHPSYGQQGFDAHNGAGDGLVVSRISAAGYSQNALSYYRPENFAVYQTTYALTTAQLQTITETLHNNLFIDNPANSFGEPGGHRLAMMDPNMKEMGAGVVTGTLQGYNGVMAFENFGVSGSQSFLTGVVYNDTVVQDGFYSLNEGRQGVTATVTNAAGTVLGSDVTGSGGGWSVKEPGGNLTVTFSGGGLAAPVSASVESGNLNAKVDLVNGNRIESNVSTTLGSGAADLKLLGISNVNATGNAAANVITGNAGANILDGKGGNDTIDGKGGDDTAALSGRLADYKVELLSGTSVRLTDLRGGGDGTDTITNVEHFRFSDGTLDFGQLRNTPVTPPPVAGSVSINDVTIAEGHSGNSVATFTVTRSGGSAAFDVNVSTGDGLASVADGDYFANSDTLHFAAGQNSQTFSVTIKGDTKVEANETFQALLSAATNGATIADGTGIGTITNDDAAAVNHQPVVTTKNVSIAAKAATPVSSMFSVSDADGNAMTKYAFWDAGNGGGHFTVDGVVQAAGKWFTVDAAHLGSVNYVGGSVPAGEKLYVTAFDGQAWSKNVALSATTVARPSEDFGGDARSDVLWHNENGNVAMWQMDGSHIAANTGVGTISNQWHAAGTEDMGGDRRADIVWQHDDGRVAIWQMNGDQIVSNTIIGKMGSAWDLAAVEDINGDGKAEIVFEHDNGSVALWRTDGTKLLSNTTIGKAAAGWDVQGAGDFNGDGKAEILLQNGQGSVAMWDVAGNKVAASTTIGKIGNTWDFAGIDDFNGDGKADILWQHDDGRVAIWQMNGKSIALNKVVGSAGSDWSIADTGDYNRDGKADILWSHDNGDVAMWQMDGARIASNVGVGHSDAGWHM